jgi:hypothetical protein
LAHEKAAPLSLSLSLSFFLSLPPVIGPHGHTVLDSYRLLLTWPLISVDITVVSLISPIRN